jgi:hypothetical protein
MMAHVIKPVPMLSREAAEFLHQDLVKRQVIMSCLNCDEWTGISCSKYRMMPPPEVLVFACENWCPDIPF